MKNIIPVLFSFILGIFITLAIVFIYVLPKNISMDALVDFQRNDAIENDINTETLKQIPGEFEGSEILPNITYDFIKSNDCKDIEITNINEFYGVLGFVINDTFVTTFKDSQQVCYKISSTILDQDKDKGYFSLISGFGLSTYDPLDIIKTIKLEKGRYILELNMDYQSDFSDVRSPKAFYMMDWLLPLDYVDIALEKELFTDSFAAKIKGDGLVLFSDTKGNKSLHTYFYDKNKKSFDINNFNLDDVQRIISCMDKSKDLLNSIQTLNQFEKKLGISSLDSNLKDFIKNRIFYKIENLYKSEEYTKQGFNLIKQYGCDGILQF